MATNPDRGAEEMERFLLLARGTRGAALDQLVSGVLDAEGVTSSFPELLAALPRGYGAGPGSTPHGRLLAHFGGGTYADYLEQRSRDPASLPELTVKQARKLRHLSILAMAWASRDTETPRSLPYAALMQALHLPTIMELEELLLDGIYQGLYAGTLCHVEQLFVMSEGQGWDGQSMADCLASLTRWQDKCTAALDLLHGTIRQAQAQAAEQQRAATKSAPAASPTSPRGKEAEAFPRAEGHGSASRRRAGS